MSPKEVIAKNMDMSDFVMNKYLGDLSDADLKIEAVEGMNSIAVQLGHLIAAERMFIEYVSPGLSPELPAGFADNHSLKGEVKDRKLATKDEYLKLWAAQRAATKKALDALNEDELTDTRGGKLPQLRQPSSTSSIWSRCTRSIIPASSSPCAGCSRSRLHSDSSRERTCSRLE